MPYLSNSEEFISRFVELDDHGRVWKDEVYQRLIDEFDIKDWKMEELLSVYENCFCTFCIPRLGVKKMIQELAKRYKLGLISNGKTPFQERNFRALGISDRFDSVLVSEAIGLRKPEAEIFHRGCSELGFNSAEAVYVGDNPIADIKGAQEAGLKTVFVPTMLNPLCEYADITCDNLANLPDIINQFGEQADGGNQIQR